MGAWCSTISTSHVRSSESPRAPPTASAHPSARPRTYLHATDGAAALQALTNCTLFLKITDFMDGWPQFVHAFQREMAKKYQVQNQDRNKFPERIGFLVHAAIAENDQRMIERLYKLHKIPEYRWTDKVNFTRAMRCAAYFGRVEMLEWMRHELPKDPKWTWEASLAWCALNGKSAPGDAVLVLDWLCAHAPEESVQLSQYAIDLSAGPVDLVVMKWLYGHDGKFTSSSTEKAAANGHLEVVRFLHEHRSEGCTTNAMDYAAWRGHLDVVRFLHEHRTEGCTTEAMDLAAREGHVEVLKFLHNNRHEGCTQAAMEFATTNGHLEALKFLHKMLVPKSWGTLSDLMDRAAAGGYLDIVKHLHESRSSGACTTTNAMDQAAANGHLEIVKFLHENRTESCSTYAMSMAARGGYQDIVTFLMENRSEGNVEWALASAAAGNKSLDLVRYLRESCPEAKMKSALERAASKNNVEIFEYLIQFRGEGDVEDFVATASSGYKTPHHEITKVVCLYAPETCTEELFGAALWSRDLDLVRTLCKYSNKGCLFETRAVAGTIPVLAEVVQVLDAFLSTEVASCSSDLHSPEGPRRCQKQASLLV